MCVVPWCSAWRAAAARAKRPSRTRSLERVGHERIAFLQHDSYYRDLAHMPLEQRRQVNFDHPDAFDNRLFIAHLDALIRGELIGVPTYDFATYVRGTEVVSVAPQPVILLPA